VDKRFFETAQACLANGERLLSEARLLSDPNYEFSLYDDENLPWKPTSLALAILAEEEFAKGFFSFWSEKGLFHGATTLNVRRETIPANICFRR
jgi:hypothetical protein